MVWSQRGRSTEPPVRASAPAAPPEPEPRTGEQGLRLRNRRLTLLTRIANSLIMGGDPRAELGPAFEAVAKEAGAEHYYNYLLGPNDAEMLVLEASGGLDDAQRAAFARIRMGEYLCGKVALTRAPIILHNLENARDEASAGVRAMGVRAYAGFPLLVHGRLLGTIAFSSRTVPRFSDLDIELIRTVSDQFAAALERGRLTEEQRQAEESLRGQKRILESVAAGAPLAETLDDLMLFIEAQEPGMRCGLLIVTDDGLHFRRGSGPSLPETYHAALDGVPITPPYLGSCGTAARRGEAIVVPDVANDTRFTDAWRELMLAHGSRAVRSIPVRASGGRMLACLSMHFDRPRDPTPARPDLSEVAVHLAGIALERARAEQSTAQALADAKLLQGISAELIREENVEALYGKILDAAIAIMHADFASLQMLYPERGSGGELRLLAHRGFNPEAAEFWEWVRPDSKSTCGAALRTGERVVAPDVETCGLMAGSGDLETYRQTGIRAVQTTPLVSRGGALVGMISTHWGGPREPSERDLRLLDILARQAADLIERSLAEAAQRATAELLGAVVSASPIPVIGIDLDSTVRVWNRAAEDVFGWSAGEVMGQLLPIVHDEKVEECRSARAALARGETIAGLETYRRRKDGSPIEVKIFGARLSDAGGRVTGAVLLLDDITARNTAARDLAAVESRLSTALDAGRLGAFDVAVATGAMSCTAQCKANFGRAADAAFSYASVLEAILPEDRERVEKTVADAIQQKGDYLAEYRCLWPDGSTHWIEARGRAEVLRDGVHVIGVSRDVTDAKLAEERQQLLTNELNHRVKNVLAIIQSMARQTARFTPEPEEFRDAFSARVIALGRVHDLLTKAAFSGARLDEIVRVSLLPFHSNGSRAVEIDGPPVLLKPGDAVAMSLALHELATNATKYGALSMPGGQVRVAWSVDGTGAKRVQFEWIERGGPRVAPPSRSGFGLRLIEKVAGQLDAEIAHDFLPEGVRCRFAMPLDERTPAAT